MSQVRPPRARLTLWRVAVLGVAALVIHPAAAQTAAIAPSAPDLGNVVSASTGTTTFRVSGSAGTIAKVTGNGARLSSGGSPVLVTISCNANTCRNKALTVRVGSIGSPSGRMGALSNFTVTPGSATVTGASGTNPLTFTIGALANPGSATFWIGMDVPIQGDDSGAGTGSANSSFYVYVAVQGTTPTSGATSLALARVFRPIAISNSAPLAFGKIVRPASGTGSVAISASNGARTVTGTGAIGLSSPAPGRATYLVSGEGGQSFTLSIPSSFQMTGPGTPLTVSLTSTASGSQSLSAAAGSAGTLSFGVGGSFPIASTTVTGAYQGSYAVTVSYN
jgi:hypothetical protein